MTKSVIIDGVEYVPKARISRTPLVIKEIRGESKWAIRGVCAGQTEYTMIVENTKGETTTIDIPYEIVEQLIKAVDE